MTIKLTKHSIKRAKERFKLNTKSLKKMAIRAIFRGSKNTAGRTTSYIYGHYNFIFKGLLLITVLDKNTSQSHKEQYLRDVYIKGKCVGPRIVRGA